MYYFLSVTLVFSCFYRFFILRRTPSAHHSSQLLLLSFASAWLRDSLLSDRSSSFHVQSAFGFDKIRPLYSLCRITLFLFVRSSPSLVWFHYFWVVLFSGFIVFHHITCHSSTTSIGKMKATERLNYSHSMDFILTIWIGPVLFKQVPRFRFTPDFSTTSTCGMVSIVIIWERFRNSITKVTFSSWLFMVY